MMKKNYVSPDLELLSLIPAEDLASDVDASDFLAEKQDPTISKEVDIGIEL